MLWRGGFKGLFLSFFAEEGLIEDVEIIRAGKDTAADFGAFDEQSADIMPMLLTEGTADALSFTDFEAKPVMDFSQVRGPQV